MRLGDILINMPMSTDWAGTSKMTLHPVNRSSFATTLGSTGSTIGGYMDFSVGAAT
jgi:hypothetical protein